MTPFIYWLCTNLMRAALWCFADWRVTGAEHCPRRGPLIIVSNHVSGIDPPFLAAALPRRVHFMAKRELFTHDWKGWFIRNYGAFPVNRFGADLAALRMATARVQAGDALALFPEGTRSRDLVLHAAQPGAGMLALRTGAPILPVAVWGTEQVRGFRAVFHRPRLRCVIGEPFTLESRQRARGEDVSLASERMMQAIAALLPPSRRGFYAEAGRPSPAESAPGKVHAQG